MPGDNEASRHFFDEVFHALVITTAVHFNTSRGINKETKINLSFAHWEEIECAHVMRLWLEYSRS